LGLIIVPSEVSTSFVGVDGDDISDCPLLFDFGENENAGITMIGIEETVLGILFWECWRGVVTYFQISPG